MPSIFTPIPADTEHKSPGIGGKPPVDRRPTGGGGGGGDDDEWSNAHKGPREVLNRIRAFVFCALAGDMMFFVVLVVLFYARQAGTHMDPATLRQIGDWHPVLMLSLIHISCGAHTRWSYRHDCSRLRSQPACPRIRFRQNRRRILAPTRRGVRCYLPRKTKRVSWFTLQARQIAMNS